MSIYNSHINSSILILKHYDGSLPFHLYLKKFFSENKKFGSKDRKQIASLCYNYFRLGHAAPGLNVREKILLGTFLCESKSSAILQFFKPEWNNLINKSPEEKYSLFTIHYSLKDIFPFKDELSDDIDAHKFNQSFLIQPKLFLRIRPGYHNDVKKKLENANLQFESISKTCIALPNSSKIDSTIELDKEAVVQDYNSQRVENFIQSAINNQQSIMLWDCCAGSGGKSIMAYDVNPNIRLTVSDKRDSIIQNLKSRFKKASIKNYTSFIADLGNSKFENQNPGSAASKFDLIIADVPCTGSGTWARTPEQLYYFQPSSIQKYSELQKQIVRNAIPSLNSKGYFLYITCSVFKQENEEMAEFIKENFSLRLIKMELLKGYEMQSDTMFAVLFTAP